MKKMICILFALILLLVGCAAESYDPGPPHICEIDGIEEYFEFAEAAQGTDEEIGLFLEEKGYAGNLISVRHVGTIVELMEIAPVPLIDGKEPYRIDVFPDENRRIVEYYLDGDISIRYFVKDAKESKTDSQDIRIKLKREREYNNPGHSFFRVKIDGIPAEIQMPKMGIKEAKKLFAEVRFAWIGELKQTEQAQETVEVGAPPAEEFYTPEEIVDHIKTVKAAGVEESVSPNHIGLYDKEVIYLLKESPLTDFEQTAIMLVLQGTAIIYRNENWDQATFFWFQGRETEEKIENLTERYGLERYEDTKYFIGSEMSEKVILWWENGEEFMFEYPADCGAEPADVIEHLAVEKHDC